MLAAAIAADRCKSLLMQAVNVTIYVTKPGMLAKRIAKERNFIASTPFEIARGPIGRHLTVNAHQAILQARDWRASYRTTTKKPCINAIFLKCSPRSDEQASARPGRTN